MDLRDARGTARGGVSHDQESRVVFVIVRGYGLDSCYSRDIFEL